MLISLILAHPNPGSFNHAIAARARDTLLGLGHTVIAHDLHAEGFDPILPHGEIPRDAALDPVVAQHCDELAAADGIIIVHPNWWGQPPAILKGWVDRVIRPGVAYEFLEDDAGDGVPHGLLRARAAVVLNTSNTPQARELSVFGDPLEALWHNCIFDLCGVAEFHRRMYSCVVVSSLEERRAWLDDVAQTVARAFPPDPSHGTQESLT